MNSVIDKHNINGFHSTAKLDKKATAQQNFRDKMIRIYQTSQIISITLLFLGCTVMFYVKCPSVLSGGPFVHSTIVTLCTLTDTDWKHSLVVSTVAYRHRRGRYAVRSVPKSCSDGNKRYGRHAEWNLVLMCRCAI
jgi:hypothetical protein